MSIILINPKYPANLGAIVRIASAYEIPSITYSGNRLKLDQLDRIPRELRMKEYASVKVIRDDKPITSGSFSSQVGDDYVVPIAVEFTAEAEDLRDFRHPSNATYVFGPEDGSIPSKILRHCHRFVRIPTNHCINLATAVATVAYDRKLKNDFEMRLHG